jgi:hypothetical protein
MKFKFISRAALLGGACLVATAFAGLSWALAAGPLASSSSAQRKVCVNNESEREAACLITRVGPRGGTGSRGARGRRGATGATGSAGPVGAIGPAGPQGTQGVVGPKGDVGPQGDQGLQGVQGAPGHTVVVAGSLITETAPGAGDPQGKLLTPTVAQCPAPASGTPEAYGGGVQIQKSGINSGGDVVTIQQHFLGTFFNPTTVTPIPPGSTPGTVSTTAANAYEGQAVVTQLSAGDTATVQAFVVCGP